MPGNVTTRRTETCLVLFAVVLLSASSTRGGAAQKADERITVGPTVHVSTALSNVAHDEVIIGADPIHSGRLIACSIVNVSSGSTEDGERSASYVSFDAGRSWTHATTTTLRTADPSCGFAADGSAYFIAVSSGTPANRIGGWTLELYHSRDGGRTWDPPRFSLAGDRPWLVIDNASKATPTPIYVTYQSLIPFLRSEKRPEIIGLFLKRSDDAGVTWTAPALSLGEPPGHELTAVTPSRAVAMADGTVAIAYLSPEEFRGEMPTRPPMPTRGMAQNFTTSPDGGQTLTPSVKIASYAQLYGLTGSPMGFGSLAVAPPDGPFAGRLYVAWADARTGRCEIYLAYSDDKGQRWSPARIVSDDWPAKLPDVGPDNNMPTLAVNRSGVVGLLWYDRRDHPENIGFHPRFRASLDGGDSWLPSVRVTSGANHFDAGSTRRLRLALSRGGEADAPLNINVNRNWWILNGHTAGLAADADGAFHALWVDNRTNLNQLYTAALTVAGKAIRNGSTALAQLEDVTGDVAFELQEAQYDDKAGTLTMKGRLRNTSNRTLDGPLSVRILGITSEIGTAAVENAEDEGSRWVFNAASGQLAPGDRTDEQLLAFRLKPSRPFKEGSVVHLGLVKVDVRVLGKRR